MKSTQSMVKVERFSSWPIVYKFAKANSSELMGMKHHQTAVSHPHSNLRGEVGIQSVKKIVSENLG